MAEQNHIIHTKIIVPQRRKELLTRPRLLDMLNDLLDYKLIILAAPAGYGKTSLMIDFADKYKWPVCWLALDPLDQDPLRFLGHFIATIQSKFKDFGSSSRSALQSMTEDQINLDFMVATITNDIFENIPEHFIIMLDDYHLINDGKEVDQFLSDFLQRVSENCHLVASSRTLLTLPDLPLLVARSQVGGMSVEELAFLPDEIQRLFIENTGKYLSLEDARELAAQSEGWITGLLLTSQIMREGISDRLQVARASGIGLYEYLAQQVLDQQSPEMQDFLLRSSLLEEFDPDMCQQVIGHALSISKNWQELMENAIYHNLFVLQVGEEKLWLRYHHLFRDFLQDHIQHKRPTETKEILLHLANFFAQDKDWERVFSIYAKLNQTNLIIQLIQKVGSAFISKGKINKLAEWFEFVPEEMMSGKPNLLPLKASIAVNQGRTQEGLLLLNNVIELMKTAKKSRKEIAENLIRRSTALRLLGQYQQSLQDAEEALTLLENLPSAEPIQAEAMRAKGFNYYQQGKLKDAKKWLNNALKIYRRANCLEDIARLMVEIGAVNETLGYYSAAEQAYKESLAYWRGIGESFWQATLLNNLGVLQHSMGDFENSFYNLEKAMQHAELNGNRRMEGYSLASIGDLYKDLDAHKEAAEAYQKSLEIAQGIEDRFLVIYLKLSQARLNTLQAHFKQAEMLIRSAQSIAKKTGALVELTKCRMEKGILDFARKNYQKSITHLSATEDYFSSEGQIEESIISKIYLGLAYTYNKEEKKAAAIFYSILGQINQPAKRVPIITAASEVKTWFESISNIHFLGKVASDFLEHVNIFEKKIQRTRRKIRKHASVVPFAAPKIIIHGFGRIEVIVNGRLITSSDWMSHTSRDFFFLFLAHPEGLTKEEVGVTLWPDSSPEELKLRFKNTIYRMRRAIGTDTIIFQDNYYIFNRGLDFEYDVFSFRQLISNSEAEKETSKKISLCEKAIALYKGTYMPDYEEEQILSDRPHYHELFMNAIKEVIKFYFKNNNFKKAQSYVKRALKEDVCDEEIHRLAMQIHFAAGNKAAVKRQFEQCRHALLKEIGIEPSDVTTKLFNRLIENRLPSSQLSP